MDPINCCLPREAMEEVEARLPTAQPLDQLRTLDLEALNRLCRVTDWAEGLPFGSDECLPLGVKQPRLSRLCAAGHLLLIGSGHTGTGVSYSYRLRPVSVARIRESK